MGMRYHNPAQCSVYVYHAPEFYIVLLLSCYFLFCSCPVCLAVKIWIWIGNKTISSQKSNSFVPGSLWLCNCSWVFRLLFVFLGQIVADSTHGIDIWTADGYFRLERISLQFRYGFVTFIACNVLEWVSPCLFRILFHIWTCERIDCNDAKLSKVLSCCGLQ